MLNLNNSYICALDIGSSKLAASVAQVKKGRIQNIFFENASSKGVKDGVIVDSIDLVSSIGRLLKDLKAKSGINIKFIYTDISGQDIVTKHSRAIIPLAERGNKVITVSDIQAANEQARILGSTLEEEIIHLIPSSYAIDSKSNVLSPLGLYSHRLEADLYLILGKLSSIQSLSRVIHQSGYEIKELYFSGLATSKAVFNQELKEGLNLFCDIGFDSAELLIFKNGILQDINILPVGGEDLTILLQEKLQIPFDLAEDIKKSYGAIVDPGQIKEDKEILVKKSNFYKPIKQKMVSEIIASSAKSICLRIKEALEKKVSFYEVDNFVVVGRSVLLEGFIETLENTLTIPVRLGRMVNPMISAFIKENKDLVGQKYLTYVTCLGMICEALEDKTSSVSSARKPAKNPLVKALDRFKEVYQEYF